MFIAWRALLAGLRGGSGARGPLAAAFGRLEAEVMNIVWQYESASVRDVQTRIPRLIAYTTVMTTLDRLFKKGLLERVREGRAYRYRSVYSRQEVETAVASGLLRALLDTGRTGARPVLSYLVDMIGEKDGALLDELEALVRRKRRQLPSGAHHDRE
jgi:predicted transcriptional regulator